MTHLDKSDDIMNDVNYEKSKKYWEDCPATVDGMLGGYSFISSFDINGSESFYRKLRRREDAPNCGRALDVGAGIGRISKNFLCNFFQHVDLLEQNEKFLSEARQSIESIFPVGHIKHGVCENFFCTGITDFRPPPGCKYDIIWIQWVLGYIKDDDLVEFFKRCVTWLHPNGVIIVKENISSVDEREFDALDSSITRSFYQFYELFKLANLQCLFSSKQKQFPKELYRVQMFALRGNES